MMGFLRAHGMDPGPLQRPLLTGAIVGAAASAPAVLIFAAFGSVRVLADQILRIPRPLAVLVLVAAFALAGTLYGLAFRRAANDRRGGWLFGTAFAFLLWMAAPVVVLPLLGTGLMAAGRAATGFWAAFLAWGAAAGALFPRVHDRLHARLDAPERSSTLGPAGAALTRSLLRRPPHT